MNINHIFTISIKNNIFVYQFESYFLSEYFDLIRLNYSYNFCLLVCVYMVFLLVLLLVSYILTNNIFKKKRKINTSVYECGFDPLFNDVHVSIIKKYVFVAFIFLLFEIEVLYIIPWLFIAKNMIISGFFYIFHGVYILFLIILISVFYEYIIGIIVTLFKTPKDMNLKIKLKKQ
jgi:NADH-quinone oxidoreductase subunit A